MAEDPRRLKEFPRPWDRETNPPPIVGAGTDWEFTPEQSWDYYHPEVPQGYDTWSDYVLAVIAAQEQGGLGPEPRGPYGSMSAGMAPAEWLQHSIGVGRLGPLLDLENPKLRDWLANTHYAAMGTDQMNIFGDQFFQALGALGAVGGAYALGGILPGATVGGEIAGGAGGSLLGGAGGDVLAGAAEAGAGGAVGGIPVSTLAPTIPAAAGTAA